MRTAGVRTAVVIAGLGPVGAVLAALLGADGVDVVVLEAEGDLAGHPRAIAADGETLRTLLDVLGPDGRTLFLLDGGVEVRDAHQRLLTTIDFPSVDDPIRNPLAQPGLSFFHQPSLERALRARLAAFPSVRVRLGARVRAVRDEPGGVVAVLEDGTLIRAGWLVGCDGAGSLVRRARGIAYTGRTFAEPWLVVDLDTDAPLAGQERFRYVIDPGRPAVAMPRPGGHRFEFRLRPGESAERLAAPDRLDGLLRPYLAGGLNTPGVRVVRAAAYTFHARTAERWRDGRVLLAGDAAHSMPPFGGQGLGAGIADAAALSWRLAEVARGVSAPAALDGYEREQRPRIDVMNRSAIMIGRLLTPSHRGTAAAVAAAIRGVSAAPVVGRRFRAGALRRSSALTAPNPHVRRGRGPVQRLDEVVDRGWALYSRPDRPWPLSPAGAEALARRAATLVTVGGPEGLQDLDGTLEGLLPSGGALLVRPDRSVDVVISPAAVDRVLALLTGRRRPGAGTTPMSGRARTSP